MCSARCSLEALSKLRCRCHCDRETTVRGCVSTLSKNTSNDVRSIMHSFTIRSLLHLRFSFSLVRAQRILAYCQCSWSVCLIGALGIRRADFISFKFKLLGSGSLPAWSNACGVDQVFKHQPPALSHGMKIACVSGHGPLMYPIVSRLNRCWLAELIAAASRIPF